MKAQRITSNIKQATWLLRLGEWGLLFTVLVLAIWLATQSRAAPLLILLAVLYIIAINFSLPPSRAGVSLVPTVAVSSLLVVEPITAVTLFLTSLLLAETVRPLWNPLWDHVGLQRPPLQQRLGPAVVHLLALVIAALVYIQFGGVAPVTAVQLRRPVSLVALAVGYGAAYFLFTIVWWVSWQQTETGQRPWRAFFRQHAVAVLTLGFLAQPFSLLGGITFAQSGLPTFVIFCLGVMVFSIIHWLSWQRRDVLEKQLTQFAALNRAGISLRETLELSTVLEQTFRQLVELVETDHFAITLLETDGGWRQFAAGLPQPTHNERPLAPTLRPISTPDDFTAWVANHGRILDLDESNMHFSSRHNLTPPTPTPAAWLGVPLNTSEKTVGVMVLQRYSPGATFSRWGREVVLAIAGQTSAAIENARLYSETVRLYSLTDEALARRLEQLHALLNAMQEGVIMVDASGRIVLVNEMAAKLLAQPAESLRQATLNPDKAAARLGYQPDELLSLLHRLASGQAPASQAEVYQITRPSDVDGRTHRFIKRIEAPVSGPARQIMGWLMLFRDVTEEQELEEQQADLARMIVHDLRNPLTTIDSTIRLVESQLLSDAPLSPGEAAVLLERARRSGADMLDMVDSLMDINRMEAGQLAVEAEAMRLPPLVDRVIHRLRPLAIEKQLELAFDHAPALPAVWADEEMIRRVLVNLLDNALKFTPAGGRIYSRLQVDSPTLNGREPGVRCIIGDTGPGIPPESREQIFARFMRTNPGGAQIRGTGLGLTFCKLAIEAHGGRIWVEDGPDGGSQFVFTLPGVPA